MTNVIEPEHGKVIVYEVSTDRRFTMARYGAALVEQGTRALPGRNATMWIEYETRAFMRAPTFCLLPPDREELREIFRQAKAAVASYSLEPDNAHQANASLYICDDKAYSIERLKPEMRRNVSLALRRLKIAPINADELLAHGMQAFCDTRARLGLSDGTSEEFRRRFSLRARCPAHVFLGAWKDDTLAAFLSITEVDDWAEIEGTFSMSALRNLKPNDGLNYVALCHYLKEKQCRMVSYGLSSVQGGSHEGLHTFKTKVGFEARLVHRAFVLNPLLAPFANRLAMKSIQAMLYFKPNNRLLKKAVGMLSSILNDKDRDMFAV